MTARGRWISAAAALLGLTGVALAAAGSHALPDTLGAGDRRAWESAVLIQFVHALALLVIGECAHASLVLRRLAAATMFAGTVLFSGSLYLRVGLGFAAAGSAAPVGGILLMVAWLLLFVSCLRD